MSPWDFAFALHGWVVILILLAQFWWYKSDKTEDTAGQRPSVWMLSICGTAVLVVIIAVAFAIGDDGANEAVGLLEWIDVVCRFRVYKWPRIDKSHSSMSFPRSSLYLR